MGLRMKGHVRGRYYVMSRDDPSLWWVCSFYSSLTDLFTIPLHRAVLSITNGTSHDAICCKSSTAALQHSLCSVVPAASE